jgi:hypothetical protein
MNICKFIYNTTNAQIMSQKCNKLNAPLSTINTYIDTIVSIMRRKHTENQAIYITIFISHYYILLYDI